jgi:hypothetical protein
LGGYGMSVFAGQDAENGPGFFGVGEAGWQR